jgi:hypothetical protein
MTFDEIFEAYYTLYRLEADIPASDDDEYVIAIPLANEAVKRWAAYDATYWKELFTTLRLSGETTTIATDQTEYDAPDDFKEAGGFVKVLDSNNNTIRTYAIIEPQDAQFKGDMTQYCFFTGDPGNGFTLHLNPAPDSSVDGMTLDYVYYKQPTLFTTGADVTEMSEPYFIIHRMLANRFRGSRNPYYGSAKADAEDVLRTMQMANNSGNWSDPWKLADNSGSTWGAPSGDQRII